MIWLIAVASLTLSAAPSADDAIAAVSNAIADGQFEKAIALVDAAVPRAADGKIGARLEVLRARAHLAMRSPQKAREALTRALSEDAELTLAIDEVGPAVAMLFEQVRAEVKGALEVEVRGGPARVFVDGVQVGEAPIKTSLVVGRHHVEVRPSRAGEPPLTRDLLLTVAGTRLTFEIADVKAAAPAVTGGPVAPLPGAMPGPDGTGLAVALRGEADVLAPGFSPSVHLSWSNRSFGVGAFAIIAPNPGARLEARWYPIGGGVRPWVGAGTTLFTSGISARGALGVELIFGRVRLCADGAYEAYADFSGGAYAGRSLLFSAGAGWRL